MSAKIRLRRMGKKKQPHYRIVVADSRAPRDGRFVENLGYYNPITHPAQLKVDLERVDYWLGEGAIASRTVGNLLSRARAGGDAKVALVADGEEAVPAMDSGEAAETTEAAETSEAAEPAETGESGESAGADAAAEAAAAAKTSADESEEAGESAEDSPDDPDPDAADSPEAAADEDTAE